MPGLKRRKPVFEDKEINERYSHPKSAKRNKSSTPKSEGHQNAKFLLMIGSERLSVAFKLIAMRKNFVSPIAHLI